MKTGGSIKPPGPARLAFPFPIWQMSLLEAEKIE
jgi:hypothetical protein